MKSINYTTPLNQSIETIYALFLNGQKPDAAKKVRGLSKIGIVRMLTEYTQFASGMSILLHRDTKYNFEIFVMRALEGVGI